MESLYLIDNVYYENQECTIEQINNQNDDEINQILLYLYNNYDKKITITELTKIFNMNRTTLSKKFKDVVGESIITYLNKVRINMAAIMLRDTELPIAEIMDRVGFVDATHFLRTFKKYIKFTPKEYRNKFCWML